MHIFCTEYVLFIRNTSNSFWQTSLSSLSGFSFLTRATTYLDSVWGSASHLKQNKADEPLLSSNSVSIFKQSIYCYHSILLLFLIHIYLLVRSILFFRHLCERIKKPNLCKLKLQQFFYAIGMTVWWYEVIWPHHYGWIFFIANRPFQPFV